jgi:hypothetical protein
MAKVGLKDTLALLAKGYSKKEIDALAAVDEENDKQEAPAPDQKQSGAPAPAEDKKAQDDAADKESNPEPDYKQLYEDLKKQSQESLEKLKKLQEQNIHKNMAPDAAAQLEKQTDALLSMVRDFM